MTDKAASKRAASYASDDPRSLITDPEPEGDSAVDQIKSTANDFQADRPWLAVLVGVAKKFSEDRASWQAAVVAYNGLFSVFPLMLAFTSIVGLVVQDPDRQREFAEAAAGQIPIVGSAIQRQAGSLEGSLPNVIIGAVLAIWSGLRVVDAVQNSMNTVWNIPRVEQPNMVKRRLRGLTILAFMSLGTIGPVVVTNLGRSVASPASFERVMSWIVTAVISVGLYLLTFQYLTSQRLPWRQVLPGATFAGLAFWAVQTFGSSLIASSSRSETYGDFWAVIVLMTIFFIVAQTSLLGAGLNVVLARRLWPRSLDAEVITEADLRAYELLARSTKSNELYDVRLFPAGHAPDPIETERAPGVGAD